MDKSILTSQMDFNNAIYNVTEYVAGYVYLKEGDHTITTNLYNLYDKAGHMNNIFNEAISASDNNAYFTDGRNSMHEVINKLLILKDNSIYIPSQSINAVHIDRAMMAINIWIKWKENALIIQYDNIELLEKDLNYIIPYLQP